MTFDFHLIIHIDAYRARDFTPNCVSSFLNLVTGEAISCFNREEAAAGAIFFIACLRLLQKRAINVTG